MWIVTIRIVTEFLFSQTAFTIFEAIFFLFPTIFNSKLSMLVLHVYPDRNRFHFGKIYKVK